MESSTKCPGEDAYLANQPVQGFSAMVPAGDDTWWTLTDNGYGARENSADYQLAVYRIDPLPGIDPGSAVRHRAA